jgi:MinD-like ATPase involved in chromosome partitioning or flagellar assembly
VGLIAIASAKGSPGVTTTALAVAALWPRNSLMVECDPAGADVAYRMPGPEGEALDPQKGILSLAAAGRRSLHAGLLALHSQQIVGGLDVVPGVVVPEQATGVRWDELGRLFAEAPGTDVIADLGRVGASTPQNVLLQNAAAVVMVVDTLPSNVIHLRERTARIREQSRPGLAVPLHVVVVAPPKRERAVREVRDVLERASVEFESVHHLAHDPKGAAFFLGQVRGRPDRTALVRSVQPIVSILSERTEKFFRPRTGPGDTGPEVAGETTGGAAEASGTAPDEQADAPEPMPAEERS